MKKQGRGKKKMTEKKSDAKAGQKEIKLSAQQLLNLFQREKAKIREIERQMNSLQNILTEILAARDAVKEIKGAEKGHPILLRLGAGILAEATVTQNKTVKKSLGGSVVVDSPVESVLSGLEEEHKKTLENVETLGAEHRKAAANANSFGQMLDAIEKAGQQKK